VYLNYSNDEILSSTVHVEVMGEKRGAYRLLVGKPNGKRPLWISRWRWEGNIETNLQENVGVWHGLIWLKTETVGLLIWIK